MKHHPAAWILIVAAVLFTAFPSLSHAEERFGPWVYYAPYYYPPNMVFAGRPFCPQDFAPRYESPNPPQPSNAVPPGMIGSQKRPVKVSSRGMHSGMRGAGHRDYGRSSISTPYVPPRRQERLETLPSPAVRVEPSVRSSVRPSADGAARMELTPAKPTPQLSSPGTYPNQHPSVPKPRVERQTPQVPDNTFRQLERTAPDEAPAIAGTPGHRPGIYSAPVDRSAEQSAQQPQAQSDNSSSKKPWTWGRKSTGTREQRSLTPPVQVPRDQRL